MKTQVPITTTIHAIMLVALQLVVAAQDLYMSLPSVAYIVDLAMDDTPIADDFVPEDSLKRCVGLWMGVSRWMVDG